MQLKDFLPLYLAALATATPLSARDPVNDVNNALNRLVSDEQTVIRTARNLKPNQVNTLIQEYEALATEISNDGAVFGDTGPLPANRVNDTILVTFRLFYQFGLDVASNLTADVGTVLQGGGCQALEHLNTDIGASLTPLQRAIEALADAAPSGAAEITADGQAVFGALSATDAAYAAAIAANCPATTRRDTTQDPINIVGDALNNVTNLEQGLLSTLKNLQPTVASVTALQTQFDAFVQDLVAQTSAIVSIGDGVITAAQAQNIVSRFGQFVTLFQNITAGLTNNARTIVQGGGCQFATNFATDLDNSVLVLDNFVATLASILPESFANQIDTSGFQLQTLLEASATAIQQAVTAACPTTKRQASSETVVAGVLNTLITDLQNINATLKSPQLTAAQVAALTTNYLKFDTDLRNAGAAVNGLPTLPDNVTSSVIIPLFEQFDALLQGDAAGLVSQEKNILQAGGCPAFLALNEDIDLSISRLVTFIDNLMPVIAATMRTIVSEDAQTEEADLIATDNSFAEFYAKNCEGGA